MRIGLIAPPGVPIPPPAYGGIESVVDQLARGLVRAGHEVLLGAAIVIGHNVFRVVPNEVPILFVLGLVSVRVRAGGWSALGFRRPESWLRLILIALAAAVLRIVLGAFVIEPLAAHWWPPIRAPWRASWR